MKTPNELLAEKQISGFEKCGVHFLQAVNTPIGPGIVQGILKKDDGSLKVIVSHKPNVLPPDPVPVNRMWVLKYYDPEEIR